VTDLLVRLLEGRGLLFTTTTEREIVNDMKEKLSYVAMDCEAEMQRPAAELEKSYELPDGQVISIGSERFRCPEALFQPALVGRSACGLSQELYHSIMRCEAELRPHMFSNIVLSGGNTMFGGMKERLERDVAELAPSDTRVHVVAPPERRYSAWIGGSILASLPSMQPMWVTKEQYDEAGPSVVHHRCF
jgi:actin-related protein